MTSTWVLTGILMALFCSSPALDYSLNSIVVSVSVPPQAYLARRIAGKRAVVITVARPGDNPHSFSPGPSLLKRITAARIYFKTGVEFENGFLPKLEKIAPKMKVVDLRNGIQLRTMKSHCHHHPENHNGHDDDHHRADDPHIWLSPVLAKTQAKTICDALSKIDPAGGDYYKLNYDTLASQLDSLNEIIKQWLAPFSGRKLFVLHPSFGYFTDAYKLVQVPIEIEGKEPSAKQLGRVMDDFAANNARAIFVQKQFSIKSAEAVAKMAKAKLILLDPLPENLVDGLGNMAQTINQVFNNN